MDGQYDVWGGIKKTDHRIGRRVPGYFPPQKTPVRAIKIDKSFVLEMCRSEQCRIIVSSTIDLAHNLGFEVLAGGVENEDTVRALQSMGCDQFQGYYLSKPLDHGAFTVWMKNPSLIEFPTT